MQEENVCLLAGNDLISLHYFSFPSGSSVSSEGGDEGLKRQLEEAQKQMRDKDEEIKFLNVKLFESSSVSPPFLRANHTVLHTDMDLSPNCSYPSS